MILLIILPYHIITFISYYKFHAIEPYNLNYN